LSLGVERERINSLNELLDAIHPSRAYDFYRRKIDEALRTFPFKSFSVDNWTSCESFVTSFFARINAAIMGSQFEESPYLAMVTFRNIFWSKYGEIPEKSLYDRIIFGREGGMNGFVQ